MSAQTIHDAFAPVNAVYRAEVYAATWGHLAPRKNRTYPGHIVFAVGCYGSDELNPTILSADFAGLDDSPWFFEAMRDFIGSERNRGLAGRVYRFDGAFRNYEFKGTITLIYCADAQAVIGHVHSTAVAKQELHR